MKALILSAGSATRLTGGSPQSLNKTLRLVHGIPVIQHTLNQLLKLPIGDVVIVERPDRQVSRLLGHRYEHLNLRYVTQEAATGIIDALECARAEMEGSDFLFCLGDEYFENLDLAAAHAYHLQTGALATCCAINDLSLVINNYEIRVDTFGLGTQFKEKPRKPISFIAGTGRIFFAKELFELGGNLPLDPCTRKRELTSLLTLATTSGKAVQIFYHKGAYFNLNTELDFLAANRTEAQAMPKHN